jgi:hypothetical protein
MNFRCTILILVVASLLPTAHASDGLVERSDVLVPDGPFGTMRKVDSETLILPDAGAVMRAQQRRTAALESRERTAAQSALARQAQEAQRAAAAPAAPSDPEAILAQETAETFVVEPVIIEETAATETFEEEAGEPAPPAEEAVAPAADEAQD